FLGADGQQRRIGPTGQHSAGIPVHHGCLDRRRAELMVDIARRRFLTGSAAVAAAAAVVPVTAGRAVAAGPPKLRIPDVPIRSAARNDPTETTLAEAVNLLRDGKLSAVELVQAHLDRIDKFEATYQAFVTVLADQALAAAKTADRSGSGPLSGIPLCIKDNY